MYTGNGTKNNPFIVDNWDDFLIVVAQGQYITWKPNCYVSEVNINSVVLTKAAEIDFNGLTIDTINVNIDCGDKSELTLYNIGYSLDVLRNLTVNNFYIPDPRVSFNYGLRFYNFYCYNLQLGSLGEDYVWWTGKESDSFYSKFGRGNSIFRNSDFYNCIMRLTSHDYSLRFPSSNYFNCDIEINYKWEGDSVPDELGLFVFERDNVRLRNCYVHGKLDFSQGAGDWVLWWGGGGFGISIDGTIFNLETIIGDNSSIKSVGLWGEVASPRKNCFVLNNGNNFNDYSLTVPISYHILIGDLKNIDYLIDNGYSVIKDDHVRYPLYANDNDTQDWTMRQSPLINGGIPFLPFGIYPIPKPPEYSNDVYENPYVIIYDMETKQNEFANHGLAVLRPTQGAVVEELNGEFSLNLSHPRDEDGKWQYILEMNIIKALGQLFVIQKVDEVESGGSAYVSAYAEHISYTLNDKWIFPPFTIAGYHGQTIIDSILSQATDMGGDWQTQYFFEVTTDLNANEDFRDWYDMSDGATPFEMLIGSNGFTAKIGGELYRDNFKISINGRMEGAQDNAFEMAVGYNLTGIKRTVDLTTFCTYFRGYDVSDGNYDTWFAVSWDPATLPRAYPRNVVRSQNFIYEHPEYAFGQLERDTMAFFNANCAPLVSYELNVVDLKHNPDYKMFTNNYRYKVGDKGRVWDERLKAWLELEITKTEKDIITGDCLKVVIGTQRSFTRPNSYTPIIPRGGIVIEAATKIVEGMPPLSFYSNGIPLIDWVIYGSEFGVGELIDDKYVIPVTITGGGSQYYITSDGNRYVDSDNSAYSLKGSSVDSRTIYIPIESPLKRGESISFADTDIQIPTYSGLNTLTIETQIQPRVKIKYREGEFYGS